MENSGERGRGREEKKGRREERGGERESYSLHFFLFSFAFQLREDAFSVSLESVCLYIAEKRKKEIKIKQQKERETVKMGEDLKRNDASAVSLKQSSDDRKLSLAASPSKRVIIKSAI